MFLTVFPFEGTYRRRVSMESYSGDSTKQLSILCCCACTMYSPQTLFVCVFCRERSKGPLVTSLVGIGTSGGPAAPLVNMLLLSGPQRHTPKYHMHTNLLVHEIALTHMATKSGVCTYVYACANTLSFTDRTGHIHKLRNTVAAKHMWIV